MASCQAKIELKDGRSFAAVTIGYPSIEAAYAAIWRVQEDPNLNDWVQVRKLDGEAVPKVRLTDIHKLMPPMLDHG
jgi:hypothetical protein